MHVGERTVKKTLSRQEIQIGSFEVSLTVSLRVQFFIYSILEGVNLELSFNVKRSYKKAGELYAYSFSSKIVFRAHIPQC